MSETMPETTHEPQNTDAGGAQTPCLPCAVYALTPRSLEAALQALPQAQLYVPDTLLEQAPAGAKPMPQALGSIFGRHTSHLFFGGGVDAAVRQVAPLLGDQATDPAVVCVDEAARFAVCVLPGRDDCGNRVASVVARALGGQAVMTAAAAGEGAFKVANLGRAQGWALDDGRRNLARAHAAIQRRAPVVFVQECGEADFWPLDRPLPASVRYVTELQSADPAAHEALLIVTDRELRATHPEHWERAVIYRPKTLVLGLACDDDAPPELVERGVASLLARHRLSPRSVRALATPAGKLQAPALQQLSTRHGWPLRAQDLDERDEVTTLTPVPQSPPSSAESAALWAAGAESLLVPEHTYSEPGAGRAMTFAVARAPHTPRFVRDDL